MNVTETDSIVKDIVVSYPIWNPEDRQKLLVEHLQDFDFGRARDGVRSLMRNFKGMPNLSDILDAIESIKVQTEIQDCDLCDNDGWVEVTSGKDNVVEKCDCGNQGIHDTGDYMDEFTSEGKEIASFDESCWALHKGIKTTESGMSDGDACNRLEEVFPKRAARLRELIDEREKLADIF